MWLRSGAFKRNPIGVEFDPDVLCERFDRGDTVAELIRQGSAPRAELRRTWRSATRRC